MNGSYSVSFYQSGIEFLSERFCAVLQMASFLCSSFVFPGISVAYFSHLDGCGHSCILVYAFVFVPSMRVASIVSSY